LAPPILICRQLSWSFQPYKILAKRRTIRSRLLVSQGTKLLVTSPRRMKRSHSLSPSFGLERKGLATFRPQFKASPVQSSDGVVGCSPFLPSIVTAGSRSSLPPITSMPEPPNLTGEPLIKLPVECWVSGLSCHTAGQLMLLAEISRQKARARGCRGGPQLGPKIIAVFSYL